MKSYEALALAVRGEALEVAKRLRLSTALIYKWTEPSTDYRDSGAFNPLDRIEAIVDTALQLGHPQKEALAPVSYLNQRFGMIAISAPEVKTSSADLYQELSKTVAEFGEMLKTSADSLNNDGTIDSFEYNRIHKETWELITQALCFLKKAELSQKD